MNPWAKYWATNRNLVYRELAGYPNEYIKNACVEGLSSACKDVGFWQNLWQAKFGTPPPNGDLSATRKAFYEANFWQEMKETVSDINPGVTDGESIEDDELGVERNVKKYAKKTYDKLPSMSIEQLQDIFIEEPYLYFLVRDQAIRHQQLDVFLMSVFRYPKLYHINVVNMNNEGRDSRDLVEDMLNALSDEKYIAVVRNTPLGVLVSLPRREENCNMDLLEAHFALNIKHDSEDYQEGLLFAMEENCTDAFEFILSQAEQELSEKEYSDLQNRLFAKTLETNNREFASLLLDQGANPVSGFVYTRGRVPSPELTKDIIREYSDEFATYFASALTKANLLKSYIEFKSLIQDDEFISLREDIMKKWLAHYEEDKEPPVRRYNMIVKDLNL